MEITKVKVKELEDAGLGKKKDELHIIFVSFSGGKQA